MMILASYIKKYQLPLPIMYGTYNTPVRFNSDYLRGV